MKEEHDPLLVVEITRMFDAYGRTPTVSQIAEYLGVIGPCSPDELRDARRRAMAGSGDFPPGPGKIAELVHAAQRRPKPAALPELPSGERRYAMELARRFRAHPRCNGLVPLRDRINAMRQIEVELERDVKRLVDA